jgi:5-methylcytosine-specific restriction endonuclease McrA
MQRPKRKPVRLRGAAKKKFRRQVYLRAHGKCAGCGLPAPLYDYDGNFNVFTCGHIAHIKSYGAGGGDTMDNVTWKCYQCHIINEHMKGI